MLNLKLNEFLGLLQEILVELKMMPVEYGKLDWYITTSGACVEDDE
ncbi:MAG: hypothetical protein KAV87_47350 [Desulfobacteraceae bacterium]|nr:hypothetical protein [Desulfobacteraceae bacterium]